MVADKWDDHISDENNHQQPESTRDDLYTLRLSPSLFNLAPREPSVDRLPGTTRSGEGYTDRSTWSGDQRERHHKIKAESHDVETSVVQAQKQQLIRTSPRVKLKKLKYVEFNRFTVSDEEGERYMLADDGGKVPQPTLKDGMWKKAMEDEYKSLIDNRVWTLVCKAKNTLPVSGKWCFTLTYGPDGRVTIHKSSYVIQEFTKIRGRE